MIELPVVEIFGPTIQGEGKHVGRICAFVRLAGCDNNCEWCDTPEANSVQDVPLMPVNEIAAKAKEHASRSRLVVITGGNPLIHQDLNHLGVHMRMHNLSMHIETQGTIPNQALHHADHITISPKPPSSGNMLEVASLKRFVEYYNNSVPTELKVVVFNEQDIQYAITIHEQLPGLPMVIQVGTSASVGKRNSVVLMSIAYNYKRMIEKITTIRQLQDVTVLPQLHKIAYGNRRGV